MRWGRERGREGSREGGRERGKEVNLGPIPRAIFAFKICCLCKAGYLVNHKLNLSNLFNNRHYDDRFVYPLNLAID